MSREEFIDLYKDLGVGKVDDLYCFSCLLASGFSKYRAYDTIPLLSELWLKDENNLSISRLSDMLYSIYDNVDLYNMSTREILQVMYEESV